MATPTKRFWVRLIAIAVALLVLQQIWKWEIERIEVAHDEFLVITNRWGKNLPEGAIIAPDESFKGVQLDVLSPGRHFINPIFQKAERIKAVDVPAGKCLVLTRLYDARPADQRPVDEGPLANVGFPVPEGLRGTEGRGIIREPLLPKRYWINPYAYTYRLPSKDVRRSSASDSLENNLIEAQIVRSEEVGVRTLKIGKDPKDLGITEHGQYVVPEGYRGVQEKVVSNGTYYINPLVETIMPVGVRSHRVQLADIQFPSRDGFILKPQVWVEYAVRAEKAPAALVRLADDGELHQADSTEDEQTKNEVLQKVILPHIRGYARIEGSNFDAKDFIVVTPIAKAPTKDAAPKAEKEKAAEQRVANNRERLQRTLLERVRPKCDALGIDIRAVTVAELVPPPELAQQISERELARVEQERYRAQLSQYKAEQTLKAAEALKQQATAKVQAETRLVQAKTKATQSKEVAELTAKNELTSAQLRLEASQQQAQATLAKGQAEAKVLQFQNEAEVAGLKKSIQGFGNVQQFAQYHTLSRLGPALTEIFASDESEFAQLISKYLTAPDGAMENKKKAD